MAGFLYFVATDQAAADAGDLKRWGLDYAFTASPTCRPTGLEVDGSEVRGLLLSQEGDHKTPPKVDPSQQVWRERAEAGGVRSWVGYYTDDEPTPDELHRGFVLDAYSMSDARGRVWQVPCVGDVDQGEWYTRLPREADFNASGALVAGDVVARYKKLWELSQELWPRLVQDDGLPSAEAAPFACELLQTLYRVSFVELGMLGVFSQEFLCSPAHWCGKAIGIYIWLQWKEAKETDPLPRSLGTTESATPDGETG